MPKKPEDLLSIEKCFAEIKSKSDIDGNLNKIHRILSRVFDIDFQLSISNNTTGKFYGMNLYPDTSTMDLIVENIVLKTSNGETVSKLWQTATKWYIDIDSILLYDMHLNTNPAEIVAVLLHEIGHVIYSNTIPQRLNKIIRFELTKLRYQMRQLVSHSKIRKIFNIAIVETCSSKNYEYTDVGKEKNADKFTIQFGYGENLDEFITKLIASQGNSLVNRSDKEQEQDTSAAVNWTITNIKELEMRKTGLKNALKVEMLKTPSNVIKKICQNIYITLFGGSTDKYRELLSEQYCAVPQDKYSELLAEQYLMEEVHRIYESAGRTIFGNLKKPEQVDIDILEVEVDKIETNDDRIYLLDRVYFMQEIVQANLDALHMGQKNQVKVPKRTLEAMADQLQRIREKVLSYRVVDKEYGVFIRYPKGYQG